MRGSLIRTYDVHGLPLSFQYQNDLLMERADTLLAPFLSGTKQAAVGRAELAYGEIPGAAPPPEGMTFFGKGPLAKGVDVYCWTSTRRRLTLVPGVCMLQLDHDAAQARLSVAPGCEWAIEIGLVLPAVAEFMREHGRHIIHSAVVTARVDQADRAILIVGESGRGKSSTALAFAGAGLDLLADDTAFIFTENGQLRVWGLPLQCKVHENTLRLLPWLHKHPRGADLVDNEVGMDLCQTFGPGATARAVPEVMVFLDERNPHSHVIEPLDKFAALKIFTDDNLRRLDLRGNGHSGDAFRLFGRLVAGCLTLRVSAGPQLGELPAAILEYLGWGLADD